MQTEALPALKASSEALYSRNLARLQRDYIVEKRIPEGTEINWQDFIFWATQTFGSKPYSRKYLILLKSSILFGIDRDLGNPSAKIARPLIASWNPPSEPTNEIKPSDRRTRPSARMIPKEDWESLINHLGSKKTQWGYRAQFMIAASVGCGARPIEWVRAKLVDDNVIRIFGAKVKVSNAWDRVKPGVFTEAEFEPFPENILSEDATPEEVQSAMDIWFEDRIANSGLSPFQDLESITALRMAKEQADNNIFRDVIFDQEYRLPIEMHLKYVNEFFEARFGPNWRDRDHTTLEEVYNKDYASKVRIAVWRACKALFSDGRLYSPADARSTFAANRRAMISTKQTQLDLGHSSINITRKNYAGPKQAWKK